MVHRSTRSAGTVAAGDRTRKSVRMSHNLQTTTLVPGPETHPSGHGRAIAWALSAIADCTRGSRALLLAQHGILIRGLYELCNKANLHYVRFVTKLV
eukprot:5669366-Prymnesium_polylepis.1